MNGVNGADDEYANEYLENDEPPCPSHFFDAQEADGYLANVAERHFASQPQPKEGEIVVQFLYRCRTGGMFLLFRMDTPTDVFSL